MCTPKKDDRKNQHKDAKKLPNAQPTLIAHCGKGNTKKNKDKGHLLVIVTRKDTGDPIKGVKVTVLKGKKVVRTGFTDDKGEKKFFQLDPGGYKIEGVKDPPYGDEKTSGSVKARKTTKAYMKMKPPKIVQVEYLDGKTKKNKDRLISSDTDHYVNFDQDDKWIISPHIKNKDRCSHKPRFKVRFNRKGVFNFKVKFEIHADNVVYTGAELGRNGHFKHQDKEKSYKTDADGTKIVDTDFNVAAAGKHKYRLLAKDDFGHNVKSHWIKIMRMIYIQEIKMKTVAAASSLGIFMAEYAKHNIRLVPMTRKQMDHIPNISSSNADTNNLKAKARTAYNSSLGKKKEPFTVVVIYTDHLAVKDANQVVVKTGVEVGPGKKDVIIPIVEKAVGGGKDKVKSLWNDIVPGEGWFISATFIGLNKAVIPLPVVHNLTAADCKAVPYSKSIPGDCTKVKVKVSGIAEAKGDIHLSVNWVNRMRGGVSFASNVIIICTRAWWTKKPSLRQNLTMIHETGHKIDLTPKGTGKSVDKITTFYDTSKGHVGTHCHFGIPAGQAKYNKDADYKKAKCVMYGSGRKDRKTFCVHCKVAVLKADFCDGWSTF